VSPKKQFSFTYTKKKITHFLKIKKSDFNETKKSLFHKTTK